MSIVDIFYIGVVLFGLILVFVFSALVWFNIDDEMKLESTEATYKDVFTSTSQTFNALDYTFLTLAVGLPLVAALSAFFNPMHPIFTFFAIIILLLFMIIFPQIANTYVSIASESDIVSAVNVESRWPFSTFIMQHYPLYLAASGFLVIIAMFGKPEVG